MEVTECLLRPTLSLSSSWLRLGKKEVQVWDLSRRRCECLGVRLWGRRVTVFGKEIKVVQGPATTLSRMSPTPQLPD